MEKEIVYNEIIDSKKILLYQDGTFTIDGVESIWYKNENGKPWIPVKRRSFIGLVKQILRDE